MFGNLYDKHYKEIEPVILFLYFKINILTFPPELKCQNNNEKLEVPEKFH